MVCAKQYGRLGNNLFQKAAAIGYAVKHQLPYSLSPAVCAQKIDIREYTHAYQELPFSEQWKHQCIRLDGYWQSEKYFAHCREEVLKAFSYRLEPVFPDTCAIHVRRGDYLNYPDKHPVVTEEYIRLAVNVMISKTNICKFKFFSDDIAWCKELIEMLHKEYPDIWWGYSEGRTEAQDLAHMFSCQHQIISNSTFSWWGAWLNQNPAKVVVSPSKHNWFGPGNAHLDTSDIIPDSWIQIKY